MVSPLGSRFSRDSVGGWNGPLAWFDDLQRADVHQAIDSPSDLSLANTRRPCQLLEGHAELAFWIRVTPADHKNQTLRN